MITYSRNEMERQLVADKALWRRVPVAFTALLWPLEITLLGWSSGWWIGLATMLLLTAVSIALPSRLRAGMYMADLLERMGSLPLELAWLILAWHLWVREPLFPLLGQPLIGAAFITLLLAGVGRLVPPFLHLAVSLLPQRSS